MPTTPAVQHQPAVKVGGRRLSVTSRPKAHHASENATDVKEEAPGEAQPVDDYPRPAPPGEERDHVHQLHKDDEAPLKKEKKQAHDTKESFTYHKLEATRPTKDLQTGGKGYGAGGRIAQPAGKGFAP